MKQPNKTIQARREIATAYYRTVLWIDDEIDLGADTASSRERYQSFFGPVSNEFMSEGLLCQLKGFPQVAGDGDPFADPSVDLTTCKGLARKADIILLDWHLGRSDPQFACELIRDLASATGSRFIVVLSQAPNLESQFKSEFQEEFSKLERGSWNSKDGAVFVLLLEKRDFEIEGSGKKLLKKIFDELSQSYPDYLHWAAIEVAGRIKARSPDWLAALPRNTDLGVLAEHAHSSEPIGDTIITNLLEDLAGVIDSSSVVSLSPEGLSDSHWPGLDDFRKIALGDVNKASGTNGNLTAQMKANLPLGSMGTSDLFKDKGKLMRNWSKEIANLDSLRQFCHSMHALGEFCEVRSSIGESGGIFRGSIMRKSDAAEDAPIFVCVSQACDCIRENSLLVLRGDPNSNSGCKPGQTFLRFEGKTYLFGSSASCLSSVEITGERRSPVGYEIVGRLRDVAVSRIIARFWGQTARVGINQPVFLREYRKEPS